MKYSQKQEQVQPSKPFDPGGKGFVVQISVFVFFFAYSLKIDPYFCPHFLQGNKFYFDKTDCFQLLL